MRDSALAQGFDDQCQIHDDGLRVLVGTDVSRLGASNFESVQYCERMLSGKYLN